MGYTEYGLKNFQLVADWVRTIAKELGLSTKEQEMCAISGFCHDIANFLSRSYNHYFGAL